VKVGPWHGDDWFIEEGLSAGDRVIVDGLMRLSAGTSVKIVDSPKKHATTGRAETKNGLEASGKDN
jgi:membrane fusion protein (multidrug efflux system)